VNDPCVVEHRAVGPADPPFDAQNRRLARKQQKIAGSAFRHQRQSGIDGRVARGQGPGLAVQLGGETVEVVSHRRVFCGKRRSAPRISSRLCV
jgi:hypothetical protein